MNTENNPQDIESEHGTDCYPLGTRQSPERTGEHSRRTPRLRRLVAAAVVVTMAMTMATLSWTEVAGAGFRGP